MKMLVVWSLSAMLFTGQTSADSALTEDGLRSWLRAGGTLDASQLLIHEQFAKQRAQLPPWWPKDVADQEEAALIGIDLAKVALPHYRPCMTDREARLLAKLSSTAAGKRVTSSAVDTHTKAAVAGASPTDAQTAGENAADSTRQSLSKKDEREAASAFTPAENAYAAKHFTPDRVAAFKACSTKAYADTATDMGTQQVSAINAVVERNRPALVEAKTAWVKDHPDFKDQ